MSHHVLVYNGVPKHEGSSREMIEWSKVMIGKGHQRDMIHIQEVE